ncbi:MAG: hypothetical protein F4X11_26785 [Acidobacteria bacterium]|nr:hypothetical protein [Acidobacteriota bacterium]
MDGDTSVGSDEESTGSTPVSSSDTVSKNREAASRLIEKEIDGLVGHLDSLGGTLPFLMAALDAIRAGEREKRDKYETDNAMAVEETETKRTVTLTVEAFAPYKRLIKHLQTASRATVLLPEIFVVALVSQYDAFLGGLVRALMKGRPEIVNASGRKMPFSQLVGFESIEAARDAIIYEEVEALLRKSHDEQFSWLESTFKLKLREGLQQWPDFVELTERRNLFVHARGIVSRQYLDVCRRHRVRVGEEMKLGKKLHVTPEYFANAHGCVLEIGVMLGQVLWRKMLPDSLLDADKHLNRVCYELLEERRYDLAATLLDFAACTFKKKFGSEEYRRMMVVNRAQAYKWLKQGGKCEKIMQSEDWSASQDSFRLADAVLKDDIEATTQMMRRIGATDEVVTKESYRDWPLFREVRKQEEFRKAYREIFGEPLERVEVKAGGDGDEDWQNGTLAEEDAPDNGKASQGPIH